MAEPIPNQIAALKKMTVAQLRERFAEVFGEPTKSRNKPWLFKRIAYRIQELAEGGLSERAKKRAEELARDADLRLRPPKGKAVEPVAAPPAPKRDPRLPAAGTELKRTFNGKEHTVKVGESAFTYRSILDSIASVSCPLPSATACCSTFRDSVADRLVFCPITREAQVLPPQRDPSNDRWVAP